MGHGNAVQFLLGVIAVVLEKEILVATRSNIQGIVAVGCLVVIVIGGIRVSRSDNLINGLDKTAKGDTASAFTSVKEFADLNDFFFGKGIVVLAQKFFKFFRIKSVGVEDEF